MTVNTNVATLYSFSLQQIVAEAYLPPGGGRAEVFAAVSRGNNREGFPEEGFSRLTREQFNEFWANYNIIHQTSDNPGDGVAEELFPDGPPANSGFSATLIQDRNNPTIYTLAIRSTESRPVALGGDRERDMWGADTNIADVGFAWAQIDAMEQYYQWLRRTQLLPDGATLNVTGYSLGGHLATVFTELHAEVAQAVIFNGAGRGRWNQSAGTLADMLAFYRHVLADPAAGAQYAQPGTQFERWYDNARGISPGTPMPDTDVYNVGATGAADARYTWAIQATKEKFGVSFPIAPAFDTEALTGNASARITHVYGKEQPQDMSFVGLSGVHGPALGIVIEKLPLIQPGDYGNGHSIVLLSDSLAVQRALRQLDPSLATADIEKIYAAASNRNVPLFTSSIAEDDLLENVLDGLRRIFIGPDVSPTEYVPGPLGFGDLPKRGVFHENLKALADSPAFQAAVQSGTTRVVSLDGLDIAAAALRTTTDGAAYRFALFTLAPFAVTSSVDLYGVYADRIALADAPAGTGALSGEWIAQRAALLARKLELSRLNADFSTLTEPPPGSPLQTYWNEDIAFEDRNSGTEIHHGSTTANTRYVRFGSSGDDRGSAALLGGRRDDFLFGGAGADEVSGLGDDDYLEGNGGNDTLRGGDGRDTLLGGTDDDVLHGDAGNDLLLGGAGVDSYRFESRFGRDVIRDSDAQGRVEILDGTSAFSPLPQGQVLGGSTWRSDDRTWRYVFVPNAPGALVGTLVVRNLVTGDGLTIEGWQKGSLGISLADLALPGAALPVTTRTIQGDRANLDTDPVLPGVQTALDDLGNVRTTDVVAPGKIDVLRDSTGNDLIDSGDGADIVDASRGGDDIIRSGAGQDRAAAGAGNDVVDGGADWDVLAGGANSDTIDGGSESDRIDGDDGDDMLRGGDGADLIGGGAGNDEIHGGAGNDVLWAGRTTNATSKTPDPGYAIDLEGLDWIVQRFVGTPPADVASALDPVSTQGGAAGDQDQLFGDAGNDRLRGDRGNDYLDGGADDDNIEGLQGDDVIVGGSGNDALRGDGIARAGFLNFVPLSEHGDDILVGDAGNDVLVGQGGADMLFGGDDADQLVGDEGSTDPSITNQGDDHLDGGRGNDQLLGEGGNDVLTGGTGADALAGGKGDDVYRFNLGDSGTASARDVIDDVEGANVIEFGPGITADSLRFIPIVTGLTGVYADRLRYGPNGEEIQFASGLASGRYAFRFADGSNWSLDRLMATQYPIAVAATSAIADSALNGGRVSDRLVGDGAGDITLSGGQGADTLAALGGANRVIFYAGDGSDTLFSKATSADRPDVLELRDIAPTAVALSRDGNDLRVQRTGTTDSIRVVDYYGGGKHIAIQFADGSIQDAAAIAQATGSTPSTYAANVGTVAGDTLTGTSQGDEIAGLAGNDLLDGASGSDRLSGDDGDDVLSGGAGADTLAGGRGNDLLDGGIGDDVLRGGGDGFGAVALAGFDNTSWSATQSGSDRYVFARGYGRDTVINGSADSDADTVRLQGLAPQDVTLVRAGRDDLQVEINGAADVLTVQGYFGTAGGAVEWIEFDAGVKWTPTDVAAAAVIGSAGDDTFTGSPGPDIFDGRGGNDFLQGLGGDDRLAGGAGDDRIMGGNGADDLHGGVGADTLYATTDPMLSDLAPDTLDGGDGNDVLWGNAEDVLAGGRGDDHVNAIGGVALYNAGDGADIFNAATVRFGAGITPAQVEVVRTATGAVGLRFNTMPGSLAPDTWAAPPGRVEFADGTVWDWSDAAALFPSTDGTSSADVIAGTALADEIFGYEGNDQLSGGALGDHLDGGTGNDVLNGEAGFDQLWGGAGNDTLNGGAGDDFLFGDTGADTLVGGTGNDTYNVDSTLDTVTELAGEGEDTIEFSWNNGAVYLNVTLGANVENGVLGSAGRATGNASANRLTGSNFGDVLVGLAGNDTYEGGLGSDYAIDNGYSDDTYRFGEFDDADVVADTGGFDVLEFVDLATNSVAPDPARVRLIDAGDALVVAVASAPRFTGTNLILIDGMYRDFGVLDPTRAIERITFADGTTWDLPAIQQRAAATSGYLTGDAADNALTGTAGDDVLLGRAGADHITGGGGNDVLLGGQGNDVLDGGAGSDQMAGGAGDDIYTNVIDDLIVEAEDGGLDTVYGVGRLSANVERMVLTTVAGASGTGYGNQLDNVMTGGAGNDALYGLSGNDTLDGGAGADQLDGGTGDDIYLADGYDTVYEYSSGGTDTIVAAATTSLSFVGNVENVTLTGTANAGATGNSLANTLRGNTGNNVLDGGAGRDTLVGGAGDDTYVVDNTGDTVTENAGEGTDFVLASVTRTLGANQEHLTLTGSSAINGTGNADANYLKGNAAANTLNGGGGNDVLQGGAGNDTLTDTSGRGVHDGGDGTDTLAGGTDRQFFAGGLGNDTLTLGGGADVVAFDRGQGADTVNAPASGAGLGQVDDTLSLGSIRAVDLRLARDVSDLVVKVAGTTDSLRLKGWYASTGNRTVRTLQLVVDSTSDYNAASTDRLVNRRVVQFDFATLAGAFDAAGAPLDWAIPAAAFNGAFTGSSDTQAIGGNLAYRYARDGNLAGLDFATATADLAAANFGTGAQAFAANTTPAGLPLARVQSALAFADAGTRSEEAPGITAAVPDDAYPVDGIDRADLPTSDGTAASRAIRLDDTPLMSGATTASSDAADETRAFDLAAFESATDRARASGKRSAWWHGASSDRMHAAPVEYVQVREVPDSSMPGKLLRPDRDTSGDDRVRLPRLIDAPVTADDSPAPWWRGWTGAKAGSDGAQAQRWAASESGEAVRAAWRGMHVGLAAHLQDYAADDSAGGTSAPTWARSPSTDAAELEFGAALTHAPAKGRLYGERTLP